MEDSKEAVVGLWDGVGNALLRSEIQLDSARLLADILALFGAVCSNFNAKRAICLSVPAG